MEQDKPVKPGKEEAGRLSALRKFIPTPEDAAMVKEMIKDGLTDEEILHALGYTGKMPQIGTLPEGHEYSHKLTTEQEEREAQAAGLGQPGEDIGGDGDGTEEDDDGDMLTHVAGLLNSVSKRKGNKLKNRKQSGPAR